MKAILTLFWLCTCLASFAQSGKITLEGQVQNASLPSISVTDFRYGEIVEVKLNKNGRFKSTATLESDGYYFLNYGRNTAYVYLYSNDELRITFDAIYFDSTLSFEGRGAERNNYLAKKTLVDQELTADLEAFYMADEEKYLQNVENVERTHQAALATYDVEDFFKEEELKSLRYNKLLSIHNYESNYEFYLGEKTSSTNEFYEPLQGLDLNNETDYRKHPYYFYLVNAIWNKRIERAKDENEMLDVIRLVRSEAVITKLLYDFYANISADNERAEEYLNLIKMVVNYQPFIELAEKRYTEMLEAQALQKGDPSPTFSYESIEGDKVSLKDMRGSFVYIDVWATWCAPCIKQVPYLKQLEEYFRGRNVVFVSISVDKKELKSRWKQMIADKQLGGVQLFADNSFDSDFMNALDVNSIPRFILIDPDGNIVETEAPRPSYEKTTKLLESLLN